jgi:hypothetical protein
MKIKKFDLFSGGSIKDCLGVCLLVLLSTGGTVMSQVPGQETKRVVKHVGSSMTIATYTEIPSGDESCAPEECEWWSKLRQAGNELMRKADEKSKKHYVLLFLEGMEKAYRVPVVDRAPQRVTWAKQTQSPSGARRRNGKVEFMVEVMADGSVGEIKIVKRLGRDHDSHCIQMQKQSIFLPAVKDNAFVTDWSRGTCVY